jgi:hypothetical protein
MIETVAIQDEMTQQTSLLDHSEEQVQQGNGDNYKNAQGSSIFLIFFDVSPRHSKWNQSSHSSHAIVSMLACCWHIGQTYCMS